MLRRRSLLAAGATLPLAGCGLLFRPAGSAVPGQPEGASVPSEQLWARIAWRYVENNTDYDTGLVNGVDRSPVFTIFNAGDALAAVVAARALGLLEAREFDLRLSRLLGFLATMDLSGGQLPNKAYHAGTGKMVGFDGRPDDIGWSAVDTGRLLLWLRIVRQRHPQYAEYVDKVVLRFGFCEVIDDCGTLYGTARVGGQLQRYQEGRLGYQQLAAAGYAAWGFETRRSANWAPTEAVNIYGLPVRHDARDPRTSGAQAPVLTMPWVLMGVELGWRLPGGDTDAKPLADRIYQVQEERWRREGQLTARTDYQMRGAPYVVLDSVFAAGYPWNTISADGREHEQLALVATRAAFGMAALWPTDYTRRLVESVQWLHDPDRGWYEGRLEAGGAPHANITLSTNAAILETLMFRATGPLLGPGPQGGLYEARTGDVFQRTRRCTPPERPACPA